MGRRSKRPGKGQAPRRTRPRELSYEEPPHYALFDRPEGLFVWLIGAIWRRLSFRRTREKIRASRRRRAARRRQAREAGN